MTIKKEKDAFGALNSTLQNNCIKSTDENICENSVTPPKFIKEDPIPAALYEDAANSNAEKSKSNGVEMPSGYRETPSGIEYQTPDGKWELMCSHVKLIALTHNNDNRNVGRLIEYKNHKGELENEVIPMKAFGSSPSIDGIIGDLLSYGVELSNTSSAKKKLGDFMRFKPHKKVLCVNEPGWHGDTYVLPNASYSFGSQNEAMLNPHSSIQKLTWNGTLSDWQNEIGIYLIDNSILQMAVCAALAAPLLKILNMENFIIHFSGESSIGKSTSAFVASSIFGNPVRKWTSTRNGIEAAAMQSNDSPLILDEVAEAQGNDISTLVYSIANGAVKIRANKDGTLKKDSDFRTIMLSTGEVGLAHKTKEAGQNMQAGQKVRFIEIESELEFGLGIYKNIHGFESASQLSDHLKRKSKELSGTPIDAWITILTSKKKEEIVQTMESLMKAWKKKHVPNGLNSQASRVLDKFAFLAAVGEYATFAGILPSNETQQEFPQLGNLSDGVSARLEKWVDSNGVEDFEMKEIKNRINHLREQQKHRFAQEVKGENTEIPDIIRAKVVNQAGYVIWENDCWNYYISPKVFTDEILCGKSSRNYLTKLAIKGEIIRGKGSKDGNTVVFKPKGERHQRFVVLSNKSDEIESQDESYIQMSEAYSER